MEIDDAATDCSLQMRTPPARSVRDGGVCLVCGGAAAMGIFGDESACDHQGGCGGRSGGRGGAATAAGSRSGGSSAIVDVIFLRITMRVATIFFNLN